MWIECISFMEHFVSIEMKKKSFEVTKSLSNEDFSDFPSINETTIDFSFTSIILLQPENHSINETIHILVSRNHYKKITKRMTNQFY